MRGFRHLLISGAAVLAATAAFADCRHTASRQASIDLNGAKKVRVVAGAGSLHVEGQAGLTQARANGTACASTEKLLGQIQIRATRNGEEIVVEAVMPEDAWGWNNESRLDLQVAVPDSVAVDVEDGSGDAKISHVASLRVEDGSGDLSIRDVAGAVKFEDGSGDVDVTNVGGDVRADDGSGDVEISRVRGSVIVDDDGSGDLDISNVDRDVIVEEDGSGSIDVSDVKGSFTVKDDGSGGIQMRNIAGKVAIPKD